jgi:hypothetical protein
MRPTFHAGIKISFARVDAAAVTASAEAKAGIHL